MTREDLWEIWAPGGALWSRWAKPVLFAQMEGDGLPKFPEAKPPAPAPAPPPGPTVTLADLPPVEPPPSATLDPLPPPDRTSVLILDLPGAESLKAGLALAERGWRPVPMFNCSAGPAPLLDCAPIVAHLAPGAAALQKLPLPNDAPPAFLLDSRRMSPHLAPAPGRYDNRWIVFPQDFPSANLLLSRGCRRAVVVAYNDAPAVDLRHVLRRWQEAGLPTEIRDLRGTDPAKSVTIEPPASFRAAWHRVVALMGFHRHSAGGFGSVIPMPGSGG